MEEAIRQDPLVFRRLKLCYRDLRNHQPAVRAHFGSERLLYVAAG